MTNPDFDNVRTALEQFPISIDQEATGPHTWRLTLHWEDDFQSPVTVDWHQQSATEVDQVRVINTLVEDVYLSDNGELDGGGYTDEEMSAIHENNERVREFFADRLDTFTYGK